ncbi:MAG TPA: bifunctional hydroxymethylpyrimidine kinase/phosphomethylpyrimidine kinase [Acidimicrobiales bacterium]|jgi:hydroxymethylpyrimidine/phosphomethylpyrimidine kinase|nr:bifunctional hydroxymethylpyrimidine kinase/phosphomethylpyrimidine kinase [Acidimicrobiales bacterium]
MTPHVALTIAGSDSGGGAGIQADLKTFAALGVYGTTAITAVTAQHTAAVLRIVSLDPDTVLAQVHAVLADLPPQAVKTGMLANPEIVKGVADVASRGLLPNLVVDPVLVSTSGHSLMDEGGVHAYRELLFPHALIVTPNLAEAALLVGVDVRELTTIEEMSEVAEQLRKLGPHTVVLKGGHLRDDVSADVVAGPGGAVVLDSMRIETTNDHGTGCSLSAAIAAELALGVTPIEAVERAKSFVHRALWGAASWQLGSGHGPIDHFGWSDRRREPR